jgi:two-component system, NtrC family, sensor histidine kinase HydH
MARIHASVTMASPRTTTPISLRRRFALTSLGVIAVIAIGLGWLMSHMLTQRMLQREGEVSMDFIQNLLTTDQSAQYLAESDNAALRQRFLASMAHVASMSEPVRANAYRPDGTVAWSTDASLIGRNYPVNEELDEALRGQLVVHSGRLDGDSPDKDEHVGLAARTPYYVESYIPIRNPQSHQVLGVMELYKVPVQLNAAIREALAQLWLACAASAVGLFMALYWTVARADKVMRDQQTQLAESQTLASAVELARAVAHNLRNPLASIRVSAEMLQAGGVSDKDYAEHCADITASVDRADRWITELVRVSQAPQLQSEVVLPSPVIRACMQEMEPEMNRRGIKWSMPAEEAPAIQAHTTMLRQILVSILANAIDVMPHGGSLSVLWHVEADILKLQITDSGAGITAEIRNALFRPFFSTKSGGLGIGLALVKRMMEQWNGQITLSPAPVHGTCVELTLPLATVQPQALK